MTRRPSARTEAVLIRLVTEPTKWHYGYDLVQTLEIPSGTLYPILLRLHDRDILESRWEDGPHVGRPRRRLYRLTNAGRRWARSVLVSPSG